MDEVMPVPEAVTYRKRPSVVQAMQWDGTADGAARIVDWVLANDGTARYQEPLIAITTVDSIGYVSAGDWIVRGVTGTDYYPCRDEIFRSTYEGVDADPVDTAVNTVARRLMASALDWYVDYADVWSNWPDIGEHDWIRVAGEAERMTKETSPTDAEFDRAYALLGSRATETTA